MTEESISGGAFLVSRLLYESAIWRKKPLFLKLFIWFIGKATYEDGCKYKGHVLKRGELITTYSEISDVLAYTLNNSVIKPTLKELRIMLSWLQSEGMILVRPLIAGASSNKGRPPDLTRAYVGLLIYIIKYGTYQHLEIYKGRHKGRPPVEQGQLDKEGVNKEIKKIPENILSEISDKVKRYPDQETISQVFQAISSNRKSNRIADSVKLSILQKWERYPVSQVSEGIRIYLDKGHADQGKPESYLLAIIRNMNGQGQDKKGAAPGPALESSGSPLLDAYRRGEIKPQPVTKGTA